MNKKTIIIVATILYTLFITLLSIVNLSGKIQPPGVNNLDKVVHFCFYFAMNVLLILLVMIYCNSNRIVWMLLATIGSIIYSIGIEIVQIYVGRSFDLVDILANSLGAFSALIFIRYSAVNNIIRRLLGIS